MNINFIEAMYAAAEVIVSIIILIKGMKNPRRIVNGLVIPMLCLGLIILVSTLINGQSIRNWLGQWAPRVMVVIMAGVITDDEMKPAIDAILYMSTLYCLVNLVTVVAFPNGLYQTPETFPGDNYFLGHRNGFIGYCLLMIFTSALKDNLHTDHVVFGKRTSILYLIAFLQTLLAFSATAAVVLLIVAVSALLVKTKAGSSLLSPITATVIGLLGNIGIVLLRLQNIVAPLIKSVLRRDATLSNRTIIWDQTINLIRWPHSILGRGVDGHNQIVINRTVIGSAHNEFLNIALQGGILGLVSYVGVIGSIVYASVKCKQKNISRLTAMLLCSILIMGITYITSKTEVYILLALFYYSCKLYPAKNKDSVK